MPPYAAFLDGDEPPQPDTGVALAETLDDDDEIDGDTVLGLVVEPNSDEREEIRNAPLPGVIVQWDHGPRGFEYLEDLAVPLPEPAV
jgi:hypothetical protein